MSGAEIVFDHVHVISEEPESAAAWYADMLGGTVTRHSEVRGAPQIAVQFDGATILVRGRRPGEQPARRPPLQSFSNFVSHDQWGADHFGFKVAGNLAAFCDAIRQKGGTFAVEPSNLRRGRVSLPCGAGRREIS